eukprot:767605-Hanusia_phi.AAC.2
MLAVERDPLPIEVRCRHLEAAPELITDQPRSTDPLHNLAVRTSNTYPLFAACQDVLLRAEHGELEPALQFHTEHPRARIPDVSFLDGLEGSQPGGASIREERLATCCLTERMAFCMCADVSSASQGIADESCEQETRGGGTKIKKRRE